MPTPETDVLHGIVRYFTRGGEHHAILDLRKRDGGRLRLQVSAELAPIADQIRRQGHGLPEEAKQQLEEDRVSGVDGWEAVQNLARTVASSRLRKQLEDMMKDPRAKLVSKVAEVIVPGWGATATAIRVASELAAAAKKGEPKARQRLAALAIAAPSDPKAASALALIRKVSGATRPAGVPLGKNGTPTYVPPPAPGRCCTDDDQPLDDVSGWFWNVPYRSNVQALLESPSSPGMIHRGLYNRGREAMEALARR